MSTDSLVLAIIGHLVGDYLLQTDWMAQNKKAPGRIGTFACVLHAGIWTWCVCILAGWTKTFHDNASLVFPFLFLTHFVQDRTHIVRWWMRLRWKNQTAFTQPPLAPWSLIVVDNVWHIVQLWFAWRFLA